MHASARPASRSATSCTSASADPTSARGSSSARCARPATPSRRRVRRERRSATRSIALSRRSAPATTLFVVASKSFSTQETLANAQAARAWLAAGLPRGSLARDRPVIAHVCGTRGDPQDAGRQEATLREAGVIVAPTNAAAARLAAKAVAA